MHIPKRPIKLLTRLHNPLLDIIHLINRIQDFINRKFLEHHVVIGQRARLVTKKVLDTTQLLRD